MFGTIRKHQTWLWAVIITAIIISFVWYFSPAGKTSGARTEERDFGTINGQRVSEEDFHNAQREVLLMYFFRTGNWPDDAAEKRGFNVEREAYYRLLLQQKQNDLGIHIPNDLVDQVARNMLRSLGKGEVVTLAEFEKKVLEPKNLRAEDFEQFIRHEMAIQELMGTVALGGRLVTPQEVKDLYVREHEELATEGVFFKASNYLASVTATPEAVSQFYSNRLSDYRVLDRVQVSYVEFAATNYLPEALVEMHKTTNLDERIEAVYRQRGTNFYKDVKTPEEAKAKIREEWRKELTLVSARKAANDFGGILFDKEPMLPENLQKLAAEKGLTVKVTAPFDVRDGLKDLEVGQNFVRAAFSLSPSNQPFAGPLMGQDGAYVIAFNKRIPSEIPPLDQVRDRVTAEYKHEQALSLAAQAGVEAYKSLTNGLAQGKTFAAVCAEAKLKPVDLQPVSISTRALTNEEAGLTLNQLQRIALATPVGKVSNFAPTEEGGVIIYVKARLPIEEATMVTNLPGFMNTVRQTRQNEAFNQWFRKEAEKGLRDVPALRMPPSLSPGAKKG